jgi:predicted regulator of Ras-like GTPase activity (Roadblock/LC7/MglB family)
MVRTNSVFPAAELDSLRGNLAQTSMLDVLQFLASAAKTGELNAATPGKRSEGRAYFVSGLLLHVAVGELVGMDALVEMCGWEKGSFRFSDDVLSPRTTIDLPFQNAIMEALRIHDERAMAEATSAQANTEGSENMMVGARGSTDVLEDFLKVPGVTSAVVVGRDGFMIEAAGGSSAVAVDDLGASLAHAINGIEEMGSELQVNAFQDLFVEYGRAVIICKPVGDAIIAITAPDASKLGIIRHKIKPLVTELATFF